MDMIHSSYSEKIQQVSAIAALLLDLGKATVGFQYKLRASESVAATPYRHGLIRFAHTEDVVSITKQIYKLRDLPTDTEFHIVVYHTRQLMLLRSRLKEKLDRILNRSDPNQLFSQPEIREAIKDSLNSNHIFIVIGTPVTEVERDHDYDWAIIEPSSMRSIIQLVGRVWRHRPDKIAQSTNVAILGNNLRSITKESHYGVVEECFTPPDFEQGPSFLLTSHKTDEIITPAQLSNINAIAYIVSSPHEILTLAELEHKVMANLLPIHASKSNYVTSYWQSLLAHHHCVHLQLISPFRMQQYKQDEYICPLNDDSEHQFSYADVAWEIPDDCCCDTQSNIIIYDNNWSFENPQIHSWLINTVQQAIDKIAEHFLNKNQYRIANEFCRISLCSDSRCNFNPYFGFYKYKEKEKRLTLY